MWAYQMQPLSQQGFRCIAYDRRSHGRSSDPGKSYDFDTLAGDFAAVLDALDIKNAMIVGHSFASGEMVRYLTMYETERIVRVVFLAAAAIPFLLKTPGNPDGIDGAALDQVRHTFSQDLTGWVEANAEPHFALGTPRAAVDWTMRIMSTEFRAELPRLRITTLLIHGDRDASFPLELTSKPTAALIPGARLIVYEGAPHGLYFMHKERLNRDLAQFAAGASAAVR